MTEIKKVTCPECGKEFDDKPQQIEKQKLILVEGMDVHGFLFHAIKAFKKNDIQVFNFKGRNDLRLFVKNLATMENFSKVKTFVIASDAETNVQSTIQSIKDTLKNVDNVDLPIPTGPFQFSSNNDIKTAIILFPGPDKNGDLRKGTIEDLCLETVADDPILKKCVENFIKCASQNQLDNDVLRHLWKSRLHAYLAGKDDHAGKKLGVVARSGLWKWDHPTMAPFKKIIQEM